jgi:hypothetical protein
MGHNVRVLRVEGGTDERHNVRNARDQTIRFKLSSVQQVNGPLHTHTATEMWSLPACLPRSTHLSGHEFVGVLRADEAFNEDGQVMV